ncbi:MAG: two-component hybrid sensor and regulator, partial [Bryobacterales bacterium]|nr:two-component hybrid sensor and regulator [Bryobacterales bacterium]
MPHNAIRLLIVDDEIAHMRALCETLELEGYSTTGFTAPDAALASVREQPYDLIICDLMMPQMDGIAFLNAAVQIDFNIVGIVMTGHGTIDSAVQAMQTGALDYILKPFKLSAILPTILRALGVRRLRMENIQLHEVVAISKLSTAIALASDLEEVVTQVVDAVVAQRQVRGASVLLPSPTCHDFVVAAARGDHFNLIPGARIQSSPQLLAWVEQCRETLSRATDSPAGQAAPVVALRRGPGDISVPMLAGGKFLGILSCTLVRPQHSIAAGQMKALNHFANDAASAIERVSLGDRLRTAEQRYRQLAENAPDIVFRYEIYPQPGFTYVNPVVEATTGYSADEHYSCSDVGLRSVHADDYDLMGSLFQGRFSGAHTVALRHVHREGKLIWLEHRAMLFHDQNGRVVAIEGIARDITE